MKTVEAIPVEVIVAFFTNKENESLILGWVFGLEMSRDIWYQILPETKHPLLMRQAGEFERMDEIQQILEISEDESLVSELLVRQVLLVKAWLDVLDLVLLRQIWLLPMLLCGMEEETKNFRSTYRMVTFHDY